MGAIQNYTVNDFMRAVNSSLTPEQKTSQIAVNDEIQEYFKSLAQSDNGEHSNIYEANYNEFTNQVKNCANFIKSAYQNFTSRYDDPKSEFIANEKTSGALDYDEINKYDENGNLVYSLKGFDDDGNKKLENGEREVEFLAGNKNFKKNGALIYDKMNVYENGELVKTLEGIDENGDGILEGDEVKEQTKWGL